MEDIKMKVWTDDGMVGPFDLSQNPIYWADKLKDGVRLLYTGLKDENGTEIYEGDIMFDAHAEIYSKVVFDEGAFCVEWDTHIEYLNEVASDYYTEVIGNIYENKKLLGEK